MLVCFLCFVPFLFLCHCIAFFLWHSFPLELSRSFCSSETSISASGVYFISCIFYDLLLTNLNNVLVKAVQLSHWKLNISLFLIFYCFAFFLQYSFPLRFYHGDGQIIFYGGLLLHQKWFLCT